MELYMNIGYVWTDAHVAQRGNIAVTVTAVKRQMNKFVLSPKEYVKNVLVKEPKGSAGSWQNKTDI